MSAALMQPFEVLLLLGIFIVLVLIWKNKATAGETNIANINPNVKAPVKVAVAALMRKPIDLMLWLEHHRREAGVYRFYIRLEDSPGVAAFLRTQPDVWFMEAESDRENNYTTLQKRQIDFVNTVALPKAREDGVDWVFHTDVDELIEGNTVKVLGALPDEILVGKLENAEAVYSEEEPTCFSAKKFIRCGAGGPCTAYANGKGCGRTVDGVQLIGPHDFGYKGRIDDTVTRKIPFDDIHVFHYDSCTIGSWLEKFQHLSKNAKLEEIVFPYYKKSIEAAQGAVAVYKEHKMDTGNRKMDPAWTYNRS